MSTGPEARLPENSGCLRGLQNGNANAIMRPKVALALPFCMRSPMSLINRFFQPPENQSFFLFGPRGTGKSTWMKEKYPSALYVDLLIPGVLQSYLAYPERFVELINDHPDNKTIIIDEVQKAPSLLSLVHQQIEKKRGLQFILTGSSARKLKRSGADLLGGRALKCVLHPFMAAELGDLFDLEKALLLGTLPLVTGKSNASEILQSYISLYLHEEIQMEGLTRNIEHFARFLEDISFSHANQLNIANVARECSVKRKTVENYINILEELLLAFQIPVFTKRAHRELAAHPKFYLFDSGVFSSLRPRGIFDRPDEISGASLEGLVAMHLQAWSDYSKEKYSIHFWRTRSGVEVDFVVYGPECFCAIEVKNTNHVTNDDVKALNSFLIDYPEAKAILLYRGKECFRRGKIICMPCEKFLKNLLPNHPLPD
jgi:predicted AAA+ superfamily ATPase